jgi:hypothetical protein
VQQVEGSACRLAPPGQPAEMCGREDKVGANAVERDVLTSSPIKRPRARSVQPRKLAEHRMIFAAVHAGVAGQRLEGVAKLQRPPGSPSSAR